MGYITMNNKEREQSKVFEQVITGKMSQKVIKKRSGSVLVRSLELP